MWRRAGIAFAVFCFVALDLSNADERSGMRVHELAPALESTNSANLAGMRLPQKALQDTVWIADWSFDGSGVCLDTGWEHVDNHILNDGALYWDVVSDFDATGGILGNAAALGYQNNSCCKDPDGYDNGWYQAIRMTYNGAGDLSFNYLVDSEGGSDFLQVEEDSACASFDLVDFSVDPSGSPARFRTALFTDSGFEAAGAVNNLAVTDFGTQSCIYIAFFSDEGTSPCDGLYPTALGRAVVIDNIVLVDDSGTRSDAFTTGTLSIGTFVNIADNVPFGTWARAYEHITDNDVCTENTTCAWLWTDDGSVDGNPTSANDPSMAFAPNGFVVRNWLDESIVSPWVSLATTPAATGTILQFRRFGGNFFQKSRIVQNWSVRGRSTVGMETCFSAWGHSVQWNPLDSFLWQTITSDMTPHFDATSEDIQVRFRTSDWQWIVGGPAPSPFVPGPGPYVDRIRIGRQVLSGPVINQGIDARSQAQDAFPTEIHPGITPGTGEHFRPTTDRFGTVAFSSAQDLGSGYTSPNLITGDSISVQVIDARVAGGITSVDWYGAIVAGPHAGSAPAPYTVGPNGFFVVNADSSRNASGAVVDGFYFVDLNDSYFLGGDVLLYFWLATDASGGVTSHPLGMTSVPASIADAQAATNGLLEFSALPTVNWTHAPQTAGDNPSTPWIAQNQENCILYHSPKPQRKPSSSKPSFHRGIASRRSGDINRTSFMYTLDVLGYRGQYDIYDCTGSGHANNHLGGRATIQQAQGYNLIIYDVGNAAPTGWIVPDGTDLDGQKVDQATWFRNWLAQASTSEAQFATLWILGSNVLEEKPTNPLFTTDMGAGLISADQGLNANPDVVGVTSFTFDRGTGSSTRDFTGNELVLNGGCPVIRNYDGLGASGTGVATHLYRDPFSSVTGDAAVVMNSNPSGNWNTILMSFDFDNIVEAPPGSAAKSGAPEGRTTDEKVLVDDILVDALPADCLQSPQPTSLPGDNAIDVPRRTELHQNAPNPFNPTTTIRFDLAVNGHVCLSIYDTAGRLVRKLINKDLRQGRERVVWDGLNADGRLVPSGVYYYRLETPQIVATRKMVVLR